MIPGSSQWGLFCSLRLLFPPFPSLPTPPLQTTLQPSPRLGLPLNFPPAFLFHAIPLPSPFLLCGAQCEPARCLNLLRSIRYRRSCFANVGVHLFFVSRSGFFLYIVFHLSSLLVPPGHLRHCCRALFFALSPQTLFFLFLLSPEVEHSMNHFLFARCF